MCPLLSMYQFSTKNQTPPFYWRGLFFFFFFSSFFLFFFNLFFCKFSEGHDGNRFWLWVLGFQGGKFSCCQYKQLFLEPRLVIWRKKRRKKNLVKRAVFFSNKRILSLFLNQHWGDFRQCRRRFADCQCHQPAIRRFASSMGKCRRCCRRGLSARLEFCRIQIYRF